LIDWLAVVLDLDASYSKIT